MRRKLLLLFIIPIISFAQKHELGNVTIEELKQTKHPQDSSAAAAILFQKGKSYFEMTSGDGLMLFTEVEVKLKIYKKEGLDWGNKVVSVYYGKNNDETVNFSKAITYNLNNGKIEKSKLNSDGEFKERANKYWVNYKIVMPNVKIGSVIEFKYTIKTPYINKLYDWYFQNVIPVNYSEYVVRVPEFYTYNSHMRGGLSPVVIKEKSDKNIVTADRVRTNANLRNGGTTSYTEYDEINYIENTTKLFLENIPALKTESFSNNIKNYLSGVEYELSSIQYKNRPIKYISETWEDVVKNIYDNPEFGGELNKDNYFEDELQKISFSGTLNEKIATIFNYVKSRITWNNEIGIYTDKGVKHAFINKIGNTAEINLILIAMLRKAGIDANPVLITTRNKAINLYPSKTAFNYVICGVEVDNDVLLMDATDKYSNIDILPTHVLNYLGRIIRKNGSSSQFDFTPKYFEKENNVVSAKLSATGEIEGTINQIMYDRAAYLYRSEYAELKDEVYLEKLEKDNLGLEIKKFNVENKKDINLNLIKNIEFKYSNAAEKINEKLYFNPFLYLGLKENPFKAETREYPIDFVSPIMDSYTMNYSIPEGYDVESLPAQINLQMSNKLAKFTFYIGKVGGGIQISSNLIINSPLFDPVDYEELKEFFNQVYLKMNEKIVLKKM